QPPATRSNASALHMSARIATFPARRCRKGMRRWQLALLWLACARLARADEAIVLHDCDVAVDRVLVAGTAAAIYVSVSGATDLFARPPGAGAPLEGALPRPRA